MSAFSEDSPAPSSPPSRLLVVLAWLYALLDFTSLYAALGALAVGVVFDWETGGWIAVAAITVHFAIDLVVGVVGYRQTMRRPWPEVAPLEDDDDDDW